MQQINIEPKDQQMYLLFCQRYDLDPADTASKITFKLSQEAAQ